MFVNSEQALAPVIPKSLRTPYAIRVWRLLRVIAHIAEGLATIFFVFPWIAQTQQRRRIRRWSQRLLALLNVRCVMKGTPPNRLPGNVLIVANHISWLDIFVILSVHVSRFVGKSELGRWPFLRHLILGTGTILIDRTKRRDTARIN